ncbi:MAG: ABC transporter ATP-binding protein, partial [Candidatus Thorarchaeota archaeon]
MDWYVKKKELNIFLKHIIFINLTWFIIDISLGIFFLYLFRGNIFFDLLIMVINVFLGSFIIFRLYEKNIGESIEFIIANQALIFVIVLNLEILFAIGYNIQFLIHKFMPTFFRWIIYIFFIPIIGFIFGIWLMRSKLQKKEMWRDVNIIVLIVNLLWLIIDIPLIIFMLYLPIENLFFDFFLIGSINSIIGTIVLKSVFFKGTKESLGITSSLQSSILGFYLLISTIIVFFFVLKNFDDLEGSILIFYISLITILGISIIFSYWGDKIQLVGHEKLISLITLLPGVIYITNTFFIQLEAFIENFFSYMLIGSLFSIISGFIIKKLSYITISYQIIRELAVLEKGKELLKVEDLKVYYPLIGGVLKRQIGAVKAVNGISFSVKTGETIGLVGESGCGKTTVARAILGLVSMEEGKIFFHNKPIPDVYSSHIRQKIQIVFQDPDASLNPRMKVVDIIAEPLRNLLGITKKTEIRKLVLRLMEEVSLKREHLDRYPHEFSGGQKQRIIIARALACNPELIILDEPTSALDVSVQAQILNLLKDLQKIYGYGYIFITHNLAVVNHIADKIQVMYLGRIVEEGNTDQIFSNPSHPYTRALLASRTEIDPFNQDISFVIRGEVPNPINPPSGCPFNPRCSSEARTKECELKLPQKIEIEENHYIWCSYYLTSKL